MAKPTSSADDFDAELYDAIEPGYYDRVYRRGRGVQWFWHHHRFAMVAEGLPATVSSLVDLGCGPGTFLGNLAKSFVRALGIDIAAPQVDYAKSTYRRPGLEFRAGDVTALAKDERFDAVVSIEVIEHLRPSDTQTFLGAIRELVKPGGTLVLTTPNYRSFWPLLESLVSRIGPVDYRRQHINRFVRKRLVEELGAAGFMDVRCQTFFVLAPFLAPVSRRLAELSLRLERRLLPALGAELIAVARRPG